MVCGVWGTLAVALFINLNEGVGELTDQLIEIAACGAFSFTLAFIIFFLLKITIGIRVSEVDEEKGLDIAERNISAYA